MSQPLTSSAAPILIDGEWIENDRPQLPLVDPATEHEIGSTYCVRSQDIRDACEAAARAFRIWSVVPANVRAAILLKAARLIGERAEIIAKRLTLCQGKRLAEAQAEVADAMEVLEWAGPEARRIYGRIIPSPDANTDLKVVQQPIGVVAVITPWNFPLGEAALHCATALAAGCTVVLKPAAETPWPALDFAAALQDAGLPNGVLNVINGSPKDTVDALLADKHVAAVAFTGSVEVGRHIASTAGRSLVPVVLELGGNAPVIIGDDYNLKSAARQLFARKLRNAGQVCTSPSRFFVPITKVSSFTEELVSLAKTVVIGAGSDATTTLAPLAHERRMQAMARFVESARNAGATVACGGHAARDRGYFWQPTVMTNIPPDAAVVREEIFGPIMPVIGYRTVDEAIEMANSVPVGLSGYAFTDNVGLRERLERELQVGTLSINHSVAQFIEAPFGGMKDSGYGRVGGLEGVSAYTRSKLISTKLQIGG